MALQGLQSSGVAFRKILSHFPELLSLAFAYGSANSQPRNEHGGS